MSDDEKEFDMYELLDSESYGFGILSEAQCITLSKNLKFSGCCTMAHDLEKLRQDKIDHPEFWKEYYRRKEEIENDPRTKTVSNDTDR